MLKLILSITLLLISSLKHLYLFQLQYYDYYRLIKLKLKNINYKYLLFIPFIIISLIISNDEIIIGSILLVVLLSFNKKAKIMNLKFTFRIFRLLTITMLLNLVILLTINKHINCNFV